MATKTYTPEEIGKRLRERNPSAFKGLKYTDEEIGQRAIQRQPELQKLVAPAASSSPVAPLLAPTPQVSQAIVPSQGKQSFLSKAGNFAKDTAISIAKPIAQTAVQLPRAFVAGTAGFLGNKEVEAQFSRPVNVPLLGTVKGLSANPNDTAAYGTQTGMQTAGQAIEIGASLVGGSAVKGALTQGAKGMAKAAIKTGIKEGAVAGGLSGLGVDLQRKNSTPVSAAISATGGALAGVALGGLMGGASAVGGRYLTKSGRAAAEKKAITEVAEIVAPKIDKKLSVSALMKGSKGVEQAGTLSKGKIIPTSRDLEVAQSVKNIVSPKASPIENIDALNSHIVNLAENKVTPFLEQNPAIYNRNVLKGALTKVKDEKLGFLKTDAQAAKIYDHIIDEALRIANEQPKKDMLGLWRSRIDFDNQIEKNFGDKVLKDETARSARDEAIKKVRGALNDFVSNHTPDNTFRQYMKELSHSYTAIDNIAEKAYAEKILQNSKVQSFFKKHPVAKEAAKYAAGGVVGGTLISKALGGD